MLAFNARSPLRRAVPLLCLAGVLAPAPRAAAQDLATAEALFNHGVADMDARQYERGCPAIAESLRLDPRPGTLFSLATCEDRWGHVATAVTRYGDYLSLYERLPADRQAAQGERPAVARERRTTLAPQVPQLTIALGPSAPRGTVVRRDGLVVAEAALGMSLPVDPGDHTLSAQAPGAAAHVERITIAKGERKTLVIEVSYASKTTPGPDGSRGPSGQRVAAFVVGGLGLAGLVLGGVTGGLAVARKGVVSAHCGSGIGSPDPAACDATGFDAGTSGKALALASTVGVVAGLAGVGVGIVLIATEPEGTRSKRDPAGGWLSAGVRPAGPAGGVLSFQGAW